MALRPELIHGVEVTRMDPGLGLLAVPAGGGQDGAVHQRAARALGAADIRHNGVLVAGNGVDTTGATGELEEPANDPSTWATPS